VNAVNSQSRCGRVFSFPSMFPECSPILESFVPSGGFLFSFGDLHFLTCDPCMCRLTLGNRLVGFVPTMGYLHEGHISLMKRAKEDCGFVVASVFVNPIQFSPNEDLSRYPRNLERDLKLMKRDSVADVVFIPTHAEMYPSHYRSFVSLENIDQLTREGTSRPDHFRGVATVLAKLFNIIQPHKAYFGQKDGIQAIVVKSMVRDLNFPIEIVIVDTMR